MANPLVSVIVPSFNSFNFIVESLRSVFAQTWRDFEIIVIDDGSTDDSLTLIKAIQSDSPVSLKIITHPDKMNHGIQDTYYLGFEHSKGTYIAIIEQDDLWQPNNLELKMKYLTDATSVGCVYSDIEPFGSTRAETITKNVYKINRENPGRIPLDLSSSFIRRNQVITLSSIIFRKTLLSEIHLEHLRTSQFDWLFLTAMAQKTSFLKIPQKLIMWRVHEKSYHYRDVASQKGIVKQTNQILFFPNLVKIALLHQTNKRKLLIIWIRALIKLCFLVFDLLSAIAIKTTVLIWRLLTFQRLSQ